MATSSPDLHAPVWSLIAVRAVTVLLAAMSLAQALLAGSFLGGRSESLDLHMMIGMAMVAVALVLTILAGIGLLHGLPRMLLISAILFTVLLAAQVYVGMTGIVGLHVPLGVLLVTGIAMQTAQAFKLPTTGARASNAATTTGSP